MVTILVTPANPGVRKPPLANSLSFLGVMLDYVCNINSLPLIVVITLIATAKPGVRKPPLHQPF